MQKASVACPGCGATVVPTGICRFCGSTAFLDGVAGRLLDSPLRCPRCEGGPPLRGLDHGGLHADLCPRCRGVWFGLGVLEEAIRRAARNPPPAGEGGAGPAHGGIEPVRYARCPVCDGGMARVGFARKPLVIVDRCPAHGDWCDGGELAQLKAVARARGMEAVGPPREAAGPARRSSREDRDSPLRGRRFPGEGVVPEAVAMADVFGGRRHRRRDLFDVLWDLLVS